MKMKVDLISYTGHGNPDPMYAAKLLVYTKSTRLEQGPDTYQRIFSMSDEDLFKELQAISVTIRSSWEFCSFTFSIREVTRAFTHQLVRTRVGVSFAQQAQRVVNMTDFQALMPDTVKGDISKERAWNGAIQAVQ